MEQIINKIKNNELIEEDALFSLIEDLSEKHKTLDYLDNIIETTEEPTYYDFNERLLIFNPTELFLQSSEEFPCVRDLITKQERKKKLTPNPNCINLYNLTSVNHEIAHILQKKIVEYPNEYVNDELTSIRTSLLLIDELSRNIDYLLKDGLVYENFHSLFFSEYDANIFAYNEVLKLLKEVNDSKLLYKYNLIIAQNILYLYKDSKKHKQIVTPSTNMNELFNTLLSLCENSKIDFNIRLLKQSEKYKIVDEPKEDIKRLKLGLSLSDKSYEYLGKIAKGKYQSLNIFDDIKSI